MAVRNTSPFALEVKLTDRIADEARVLGRATVGYLQVMAASLASTSSVQESCLSMKTVEVLDSA
jgi:hypothetical protein